MLAEAHGELGGGQEVQVDVPAEQVGQTALEVRPQQRSPDQDRDRGERVAGLAGGDLLGEGVLEGREGAEDEAGGRLAGLVLRVRIEAELVHREHQTMVSRGSVAVSDTSGCGAGDQRSASDRSVG